jgi:hypothetical protein
MGYIESRAPAGRDRPIFLSNRPQYGVFGDFDCPGLQTDPPPPDGLSGDLGLAGGNIVSRSS